MIKYLILSLLCSCAYLRQVKNAPKPQSTVKKVKKTKEYNLTDKAGKFVLKREVGTSKKYKGIVVKKLILPEDSSGLPLEKSITISKPGSVQGKINILRPQISQYSVWFDKKRYFSEMKLNPSSKTLEVFLKSPKKQWNGKKSIPFPSGSGMYCFFSQVVECAKFSQFIQESTKRGAGQMNFHIVWEGYPYFQAQYDNLPSEVFSNATMTYDGVDQNGNRKYSLNFANQTLFYLLDKQNNLVGEYWVSQGYSLESKL